MLRLAHAVANARGAGHDRVATLEHADRAVAAGGGQCALAIAGIASGEITGASVGDCCIWLLKDDGIEDLTESQIRKPLIGSGRAVPTGFASPLAGTVLAASDGLWKYVQRNRIAAMALESDLETAAGRLVEAARLQSGDLQDDLSVILCRIDGSLTL